MRVIGFNFTKISIENLKQITKGFKINTEIDVPEIKSVNLKASPIKTKDEPIEVKFIYSVNYEPDFVKVRLEGNILFSIDSKTAKEILKQWKSKKMPEDFRLLLFNVILKKSTLKALYLEDELNLPLHTPMPSFKKPKEG